MRIQSKILIGLTLATGLAGGVYFGGNTDEISTAKIAEKYNQAPQIQAKYSLNEAQLVLSKINNPELDAYKHEPKDEIKITIGDNTPVVKEGLFGAGEEVKEFTPKINLKRWNEVEFSITPKGLDKVATKDKTLSFEGDKIKFDTPKISFEMYDYPEGEGSYKMVWFLNSKPDSNVVNFEISAEGLDFFYQPPLTQEYKDGYSEEFKREIIVSETQVKDLEGNDLVERPENVVGSYAVYHQTKGGMVDAYGKDYKTGQAFFIYRPRIIDAEGKETWGILNIDVVNGIYSVEIPQDFLDKAVYPIKSNDEFGFSGEGGSSFLHPGNGFAGCYFNMVASGNASVDYVKFYGNGNYATRNAKGVMVADSDKTILANGVTGGFSITSIKGWWQLDYVSKPSVVSGNSYFPGFVVNADYVKIYSNSVSNNGWRDDENNYTTPTDPTDGFLSIYKISLYATYTPAGGGAATPEGQLELKSGTLQIKSGTFQVK